MTNGSNSKQYEVVASFTVVLTIKRRKEQDMVFTHFAIPETTNSSFLKVSGLYDNLKSGIQHRSSATVQHKLNFSADSGHGTVYPQLLHLCMAAESRGMGT